MSTGLAVLLPGSTHCMALSLAFSGPSHPESQSCCADLWSHLLGATFPHCWEESRPREIRSQVLLPEPSRTWHSCPLALDPEGAHSSSETAAPRPLRLQDMVESEAQSEWSALCQQHMGQSSACRNWYPGKCALRDECMWWTRVERRALRFERWRALIQPTISTKNELQCHLLGNVDRMTVFTHIVLLKVTGSV